jgi:hypothetical protein
MIAGLFLSVLLITGLDDGARVVRLPPVDQCAADPSFAAFRTQLVQAIVGKDRAYLLSILSDDILVDLGGGTGQAAFVEAWHLDDPETSAVWDELGEVLRLGCIQDPEQGNWSPSMFASGEIDDPFGTALVIRPSASLYAAPDANSPRVATLGWDLVSVVEWNGQDSWQRVQLADGREGYARSADLRSPVDYRAGFRRIDGRWRITVFIAGD